MGSTSLVSLVVELVENLAKHVADVADVGFVVVPVYVVMRHAAHVAIQPVDGDVDAVERPPAEEPGNGHGDVEEYLVVHHLPVDPTPRISTRNGSFNAFWLSEAKALVTPMATGAVSFCVKP